MCILFLLVGDKDRPTLICSNRDEYYGRKTVRGDFDSEGFQYSPLDVEGGGTWLSAAGLDQGPNEFRYAVVLNFHHWREQYPFRGSGEKKTTTHASPNLKSRGLLIKNFMEDLTCSAMTYANIIYKDRALYRPFNLVVSDRTGTFYVSSSRQQMGKPELLKSGRLYSVSNGYLHDTWQKTYTGRLLVGKALIKDYNLFAHADSSAVGRMPSKEDAQEFSLVGEPSLDIKFVMLKLMQVMKNDSPLPDATFGSLSAPAMQLSSIFVKPTIILRQPFQQRANILLYLARAIIDSVKDLLQYIISSLILSHVEPPEVVKHFGSDWFDRMILFLHTAAVLGVFLLPTKDQTSGPFAHNDLFGTRTITLIYHMPRAQPTQGSRSAVRKQPQSDFCIMEKDLNPVSMVWSTNEFSNIE